MRRRDFFSLFGGVVAAWPLAARAQHDRIQKLGILSGNAEDDPNNRAWFAAFDGSLQSRGWVEGQNIIATRRFAPGDLDRTRTYAKELVALGPDLIFVTNTPAATAILQETHSIPLLFVNISDPLGSGLVSNMANPGGNATGFTNFEFATAGKWAQLMRDLAPDVRRMALIFKPETAPFADKYFRPAQVAATSLGIELTAAPVHDRDQIEAHYVSQAAAPGGSIMLIPDNFIVANRRTIISLSARYRLPTISPYRVIVIEGGLIAYGPDIVDLFRRSGIYADRILKGENPATLPVQQPTKFELVINLKTAKALGLTVPPSLLAIADEVIE